MTDQQTPDDDAETVSLNLTLREVDGPTMVLRQVALGHAPMILVELSLDDDEQVVYSVDATGPEDVEQLATLLEGIVEILRDGSEAS